jgi:hypothetical protein
MALASPTMFARRFSYRETASDRPNASSSPTRPSSAPCRIPERLLEAVRQVADAVADEDPEARRAGEHGKEEEAEREAAE